ncbi:hypothetical protein E2C01_039790 [Portunus trituberculatus]|uniref:Uncharacterized protein n=1 Tax=Portunus trituberculatus TaxID=210409 RepID=A0A5B7FFN6_PORTR|nr:hypothetical protein [Portunus trituberculatus]
MAAVRPREGVIQACPVRVSSLPLLLKKYESYLYPTTRGKHFIRDSSTATPRPSTPSTSSLVFVVLLAVLIFSVYFKSIFCGPDLSPSQARHTAAVFTPGNQQVANTAPLWADGTVYLYHHLMTIWLKTCQEKQ